MIYSNNEQKLKLKFINVRANAYWKKSNNIINAQWPNTENTNV